MTSSTGCGSGVFAGTTGLHLNNMLGEEDLTGYGAPRPGERLTSMMSPTIAEGPDGAVLVAGSSGSARIRSAMHRVLSALIEHGLEPRERRRPAADPRHAGRARLRVRVPGGDAGTSWPSSASG